MNNENKLVRKYFKIKNPYEEGILKVVDLEDAVDIANSKCKTCKNFQIKTSDENGKDYGICLNNSNYHGIRLAKNPKFAKHFKTVSDLADIEQIIDEIARPYFIEDFGCIFHCS